MNGNLCSVVFAYALVVRMCAPSCAHADQGFSLGLNFSASDSTLSNASSIPPDSMGAVGPSHIGVLLNGRWSVYDKQDGSTLVGSSLNQFWADAGVTATNVAFDSRLLYDDYSGRWFAVSVDNKAAANSFLVGVSSTDDPTGSWTGYKIDADTDDLEWADFSTLGINADAVTITANMDPIASGSTTTSNILVIPKTNLLAAAPAASLGETLIEGVAHSLIGDSTQPAVDLTGGSMPTRLLSENIVGVFELKMSTISGPATAPTLVTSGADATTSMYTGQFGVTPADIAQPLDPEDPVARAPIDGGRTRFSGNVVIQQVEGRSAPTMWAVNTTNEILGAGTNVVNWFEIDPDSKAVLQTGSISDPSLSFNYPSISVNPAGDVVIGFSGGDTSTFMSTYVAVGRTRDGVTTFGDPKQTQAGQGAYEVLSNGSNRWGDYSATVLDPDNPNLFWTFQEFASATDQWQIQITQLSTLLGDFDADGDVDADDINLLAANAGGTDLSFDLNGDQVVDYSVGAGGQILSDSDVLIREILMTEYGDSNLDGLVDGFDFSKLSSAFGSAGGWGDGDFSGDGSINGVDFSLLSSNFGFDNTSGVAVPEPGAILLGLLAIALPGGAGRGVRR